MTAKRKAKAVRMVDGSYWVPGREMRRLKRIEQAAKVALRAWDAETEDDWLLFESLRKAVET